ncbi:MAG TPA: hypothetical protein VIL74_18340 [Pyrinomonadaceae bacterium]
MIFITGATVVTSIHLKFFHFRSPLPELALPTDEADTAESNPLTFCELANNPEKYDGETVRLAAKLHTGLEGSWFSDDLCGADNAAVISAENNDVWKAIEKATANGKREPWDAELNLVVVGKFKNVVYKDWCCLTAPFQFEILSVEKASKTK